MTFGLFIISFSLPLVPSFSVDNLEFLINLPSFECGISSETAKHYFGKQWHCFRVSVFFFISNIVDEFGVCIC